MPRRSNPTSRDPLGSITVEALPAGEKAGRAKVMHESLYVWTPSPEVGEHLPRDFRFAMKCCSFPGGQRRFVPLSGPNGFVAQAWIVGLAIQGFRNEIAKEALQDYRANWLLFHLTRNMQEYFTGSFGSVRSLILSRRARAGESEGDVLPPGLGLDRDGQGEEWSIVRLLEEGALAAAAADLPLTEEEKIHHGLLAAARRHPLEIPFRRTSRLIRSALFDCGPEPSKVPAKVLNQVHKRHSGQSQTTSKILPRNSTAGLRGGEVPLSNRLPSRKERPAAH